MERYKSHIAQTDEYGSRCEYCLQAWPCDAVERAGVVAVLEADLRAVVAGLVQVIDCWNSAAQEPAGRVCDVCINVADAVLSRPTVAALREEE